MLKMFSTLHSACLEMSIPEYSYKLGKHKFLESVWVPWGIVIFVAYVTDYLFCLKEDKYMHSCRN